MTAQGSACFAIRMQNSRPAIEMSAAFRSHYPTLFPDVRPREAGRGGGGRTFGPGRSTGSRRLQRRRGDPTRGRGVGPGLSGIRPPGDPHPGAKEGPGGVNERGRCGGAVVRPGDIVVADEEGIVVALKRKGWTFPD